MLTSFDKYVYEVIKSSYILNGVSINSLVECPLIATCLLPSHTTLILGIIPKLSFIVSFIISVINLSIISLTIYIFVCILHGKVPRMETKPIGQLRLVIFFQLSPLIQLLANSIHRIERIWFESQANPFIKYIFICTMDWEFIDIGEVWGMLSTH